MKKIDSKFLDSSAWLSYFLGDNQRMKDILDSNIFLLSSALSIFEVERKLLKEKIPRTKIENIINFIKKRSLVVEVEEVIAEAAAARSYEKKLATIDALIYESALAHNAVLLTADYDFQGLSRVEII